MDTQNYVYPAKIGREEGLYTLSFLDLDIYVEEESFEELIFSAQDQLALMIIDMLDRNETLPSPSEVNNDAVYIHIWLPYYRTAVKEIYVKKTVTIPQWLDILAKEKELNFSAALVYGLKARLGLDPEK